jgi:hypothetical protein
MSETAPPDHTFLSGESGTTVGRRLRLRAGAGDLVLDLRLRAARAGRAMDELAEATPERSVLVIGPYRPRLLLARAVAELRESRHRVRFAFAARGELDPDPAVAEATVVNREGGKWELVNLALEAAGGADADWLIVIDDDVRLPPSFLDRFVAVCERLEFALAQPAQSLGSHAAWQVARRQPGALARETRFVEIGPLTAFRRDAAAALTPFPDLRWGWGLDLHWAALAGERGWRLGVVDALPVDHTHDRVAGDYSYEDAIEEARRFLTGRRYVHAADAKRTVATHRSLRRR